MVTGHTFYCSFENDRTISFIPPDGEFELMSYRLNTHVSYEVFEIFHGAVISVAILSA